MEANNTKAMREALKKIVELTAPREGATSIELQVHAEAVTALAEPPRNCDVGTAEEQYERWQAFCDKYGKNCTGCPCDGPVLSLAYCFSSWAQLPYDGNH